MMAEKSPFPLLILSDAPSASSGLGRIAKDSEEWRPVVGYEGVYEISSYGRLRRCDNSAKNHSKCAYKRPSLTSNGYWRTMLCQNAKRSYYSIHVLVASAFFGPRPKGMHIDHKDGNRQNNHLDNLEYVSAQTNVRRAITRNLRNYGKRRSDAKLNENDVKTIKLLCSAGTSQAELARQFGVSAPFVNLIIHEKKWKGGYGTNTVADNF